MAATQRTPRRTLPDSRTFQEHGPRPFGENAHDKVPRDVNPDLEDRWRTFASSRLRDSGAAGSGARSSQQPPARCYIYPMRTMPTWLWRRRLAFIATSSARWIAAPPVLARSRGRG